MFVDALAIVSLTGIACVTAGMGAFTVGMPMLLVLAFLPARWLDTGEASGRRDVGARAAA
jgi:hypothetical protein